MSGNSKKDKFLQSISLVSIEEPENTLAQRCKFNFSYFSKQAASQDYADWSEAQLVKLLNKLGAYSSESLSFWTQQRVGKSGSVLALYGAFPEGKTDFVKPPHVPHQAVWGRFRLEQSVRLVGFTLPSQFHNKAHHCGALFDCNTFYVVFLDENHLFYKCKKEAK